MHGNGAPCKRPRWDQDPGVELGARKRLMRRGMNMVFFMIADFYEVIESGYGKNMIIVCDREEGHEASDDTVQTKPLPPDEDKRLLPALLTSPGLNIKIVK